MSGGRLGATTTQNVTFALTGGSNSTPQAGDLVVVSITVSSTADRAVSVVTPTGYTSLTELYQNDTYDVNLGLSYKFMGSTPDTTFQLPSTGNAADAQSYTVHVYRGVDTNNPLDVAAVTAGGINSRTVNPGAITPVTPGAWIHVVGAGAGATGGTYTAAYLSGFLTNTQADTNDSIIGAGYYSGWTSGAYDPAAFGAGGTTTTNDSWAAYTIALRPASGDGSVGSNTANGSNYLSRSFTPESVISYGSWFHIDAIDPGDSTAIIATSGGAPVFLIGVAADGKVETFRVSDSTYTTILPPGSVSPGDWLYLGLAINGASARACASLDNAASAVVDVGGPSASIDGFTLLVYPGGFNPLGAHVSHTRAWSAYLTQSEFDSERNAADAVRSSGLLFDSDLPNTANYGGWTSNGTLTTGPLTPYLGPGTTVVGADLAGTYSIVGQVGANLAGAYALNAPVGADRSGAYALLNAVSADLAGSYVLANSVGSDLAGGYGLAGAVQSDLVGTYAVLNTVAGDNAGSYALLNAVGADQAGAYAIRNAVGSDLGGAYGIASNVGADHAGAYALSQAVGQDFGGSYGLRQAVSADLAGAYEVRATQATAGSDLSGSYAILTSFSSDCTGGYAVRQSVIAEMPGAYSVRQPTTANLDGSYDVSVRVSRDLDGAYSLLSTVAEELHGAYAVAEESTAAFSIKVFTQDGWVDAPIMRWTGDRWVNALVRKWDGSAWTP